MTLVFRQLQDPTSSTYTYLLADPATHEAILIDPVFEQAARDTALLRELGLPVIEDLWAHSASCDGSGTGKCSQCHSGCVDSN